MFMNPRQEICSGRCSKAARETSGAAFSLIRPCYIRLAKSFVVCFTRRGNICVTSSISVQQPSDPAIGTHHPFE